MLLGVKWILGSTFGVKTGGICLEMLHISWVPFPSPGAPHLQQ